MGLHPLGELLPNHTNYANWSWADKQFLRHFLCSNINVTYLEQHIFDPTFYPVDVWYEIRKVKYKCQPMIWRTKNIRVIFVLPSANASIENTVTHPDVKDYCLQENGSYLKTDDGYVTQQAGKNLHRMYFVRSNTFDNMIEFNFGKQLNTITAFVRTFHSDYLEKGSESSYNGWNFTNNVIWDALNNESMWYDPSNSMLV